jgi:hypothetical protein
LCLLFAFWCETVVLIWSSDVWNPPSPRTEVEQFQQNTQHLKLKYELLLKHDAFARGNTVAQPGDRHHFAEYLDWDVIAASLAAKLKLKTYRTPAWSVKLAKVRPTESFTSLEMRLYGKNRPQPYNTTCRGAVACLSIENQNHVLLQQHFRNVSSLNRKGQNVRWRT